MNTLAMSIPRKHRSVAIVSGKGGSGKTMIAAVMAELFDSIGSSVILVDADTGTAGLSFYLGLEQVRNTSVGVSNLLTGGTSETRIRDSLQPIRHLAHARFLSAGDRRASTVGLPDLNLRVKQLISGLDYLEPDVIIVDCRGGVDLESLAFCQAVDDIILIVESDTTSFQASRDLVEMLGSVGIAPKLAGFIINKVFEDPSTVARNGTALFGTQFLSAIPFDFEAMRDFFVGRIPSVYSVFAVHVQHALHRAFPDETLPPDGHVYTFTEFREVGLTNLDSLRGGLVASACIIFATVLFILSTLSSIAAPFHDFRVAVLVLSIVGLLGASEGTRRFMGRALNNVMSILLKPLQTRR